MSVYLGKQRQHTTAEMTATHGTALQVIPTVVGVGHKTLMDNYFTRLICSNGQSMRVENFAMTGVECHEILDQNL
jgi:hypothetical protein